jgi:hypothetical protein
MTGQSVAHVGGMPPDVPVRAGCEVHGELDALNWAWGDIYDMGINGGKYFARRVEGHAETLVRDTLGELNIAIREDWCRKAVRDFSP